MTVSDPEAKLTLAAMSSAWLRLADFVELHGPNEQTNAGASEQVAQQQQQIQPKKE